MLSRIIRYGTYTILAIIVALAAYVAYWAFVPSIPRIAADRIASVEFEVYTRAREKNAPILSTDTAKIEAVLKVLATAERASEHLCVSQAALDFIDSAGKRVSIELLPGHDEDYYEYRYDGRTNQVKRAPFREALRGIGVAELPVNP